MKITSKQTVAKIVVLIIVVVIGLNMRTILVFLTGSSSPIAVVRGYSMYPLLREGDLVFAYKPPPYAIREGDIIIYRSVRGALIIHRVVEVKVIDDKYYYVTKGDNNSLPDYMEFTGPGKVGIPYDRVEGVVLSIGGYAFKIPYLGYLSIWYHGGR
ncbi:MAG: signal peptidase I [Thermoprotei archaeon]